MERGHRGTEAVLWGAIVALLAVIAAFQSNSAHAAVYGQSCLSWMSARWSETGSRFSHGWLLPLVSLGLVLRDRRLLASAPRRSCRAGLAVIVAALVLHVVGYRAMFPHLNVLALLGLLWGIPLYLLGWPTARLLAFPVAYLALGIPLDFLDKLTFPLRLLASAAAAALLNGLGIACLRAGTVIQTAGADGFGFDVGDPCSGLRYILAITALMALYAYAIRDAPWKRWILFLLAVPVAIAGNVARIVLIGVVGRVLGAETALGLYHDYSGYLVFAVVLLLMLAADAAMPTHYRERRRLWTSGGSDRT
jgi:exosortase